LFEAHCEKAAAAADVDENPGTVAHEPHKVLYLVFYEYVMVEGNYLFVGE
jgi:hypothetical protein